MKNKIIILLSLLTIISVFNHFSEYNINLWYLLFFIHLYIFGVKSFVYWLHCIILFSFLLIINGDFLIFFQIYIFIFYSSLIVNYFLLKKGNIGLKIKKINSIEKIDNKIKFLKNGIYCVNPNILREYINNNVNLSNMHSFSKILIESDFYIYKNDNFFYLYQTLHLKSYIFLLKLFFPYKYNIYSYLLKGKYNNKLEYRIAPIIDFYSYFIVVIILLSLTIVQYAPIPYIITLVFFIPYCMYRINKGKITNFLLESIVYLVDSKNLQRVEKIIFDDFFYILNDDSIN